LHGDNRKLFEPGEALFVPAGDVHRSEDISDDFAAWILFYGSSEASVVN
jgi:quercetin dioxygenase-like cupin family protein